MSTNVTAGKTMNDNKVKNLVITAFFTAITFLGIQSFRIPLPAAVGTPFLHFGHIFVVMGLLLQGGKRGAVSGTLGLTIFDMLNGYMQDAPKTFVETAVKCLIVGALFLMLKRKADGDRKKEYGAAVICAFIYGCINVIMEFIMSHDNITSMFQNMTAYTGKVISYAFVGHYHCEKVKTFNNFKVYVNGSIVGVDQYAFSRRLFGKPSQTLLIFDGDNVMHHSINLDIQE